MKSESDIVSIQTRLRVGADMDGILSAYAERYGRNMGRLNRILDAGVQIKDAKRAFVSEGLTARQFNAMAIDLQGKRASRATSHEREIADKERKVTAIERRIKSGEYAPSVAHQKRRRLARLRAEVPRLKIAKPSMTFGGRKLWHAQNDLDANGYADHEEWLADWRSARSSEFFLVGSKDERRGNQSCQYDPIRHELVVRLPGGRVVLNNVRFLHGQEVVEHAVLTGQAISYRFVRKKKGWYVHASTRRPVVERVTDIANGVIGVDVGPGCAVVVETDEKGNPVWRKTFPLALYKKGTGQVTAILRDVAKEIGDRAVLTGKPVVVEELDFERKKAELRERGNGYARMLSAFAYAAMLEAVRSRCARHGVQVIIVNPAYTSVIGVVKYAAMYGLSADEAAALVLARRGMNLKESLPTGDALERPEDRSRHAWARWRRLGKAQRSCGRHAFVAATRGSGGRRGYPASPARGSPASRRTASPRAFARPPGGSPGANRVGEPFAPRGMI